MVFLLKNTHLRRLKTSREFQDVYALGTRCSGRYFFSYVQMSSEPYIFYGITVTRRVGNAVVRNRIKRIMREAIRHCLLDVQPGFVLVLVARSAARHVGFHPVMQQLRTHVFEYHALQRKRTDQAL